VPDQLVATQFYVSTLGLTRDPYMMTGVDNMWVNAGATQFHLPHGAAQHFRGTVKLVIPDREALLARLQHGAAALRGTAFSFEAQPDHVAVRCPWGNALRIFEPDPARLAPSCWASRNSSSRCPGCGDRALLSGGTGGARPRREHDRRCDVRPRARGHGAVAAVQGDRQRDASL
jgi:hypothetical protein